MNSELVSVNLSREVFDECIRLSPGFRSVIINAYAESSMPVTERLHRELLHMLSNSRDSACSDGFNKICFIKKIREDSKDGRMKHYFMTFPGFLTESNDVSMGLADARRLAEHYILHFKNHI